MEGLYFVQYLRILSGPFFGGGGGVLEGGGSYLRWGATVNRENTVMV